jgi:hypothetical protein
MGWPTQIGRWAALGKNSQKYQLFGPLFDKNQNIEKSLTFDPSLGRGLATPELEKVLKTLQIMPKVTTHPLLLSIRKSVTSHIIIAAQPQAQIKEV